jgi:large subunit ribosomal protein L4
MAKVNLYSKEGKKLAEIELNSKIFDVEFKQGPVHEAAVAALANSRKAYAHAKDRSEVRGGGRKPWRQKGTGRARHGSVRSPIWVGGGITFGPSKERNFSVKINKKIKRKALLMALSERAREKGVIVVEDLKIDEPKTKHISKIINSLPALDRRVLVVLGAPDKKFMQAVKNMEKVHAIGANNLNILDILKYPKILFTKEALSVLDELYSLKK